jgi:hypothetical protein
LKDKACVAPELEMAKVVDVSVRASSSFEQETAIKANNAARMNNNFFIRYKLIIVCNYNILKVRL